MLNKNIPIAIDISDPWDLGELLNWQPLVGEIFQFELGQDELCEYQARIRLMQKIDYKHQNVQYILAIARSQNADIRSLESKGTIACNCVGMTESEARQSLAINSRKLRSGFFFIGDIKINQRP